jgi:hypothetical protein
MEDGWDGDAETLFQSNQESDNAAGEEGAVPDAEPTARDDFSPELFDEDEVTRILSLPRPTFPLKETSFENSHLTIAD